MTTRRLGIFILLTQGAWLTTIVSLQAENTAKQNDLTTPEMTTGKPAAGKRVRCTTPEYQDTEVHHALYLPTNWKPNSTYPVIVEYTGNRAPKYNSTGKV